MRPRPLPALLAALLALAACEKHEFDAPSRELQVERADSAFSEALFDTIQWPGDSARAFEGNNVFAAHCRQCHGPMGAGGTEYAAARELEVPSLVQPDWRYGTDLGSVRRRIFTGHPAGMPTWGVAGITAREIDAVAFYLLFQLRPEVIGRTP
jgi:mono/diheme cytochrome c family protein